MTHPWRRYVAIGDSFTEGVGDDYPDGTPRGWADLLAQGLADRAGEPVGYANLAIRGRLLGPILAEQLQPALDLAPDLVSIIGGGNDLLRPAADPDDLAAQLEDAVVALKRAGATVLMGIGVDPRESGLLELIRKKEAVFNTNLFTIAHRHGAHVVNLWGMRCLHDWQMWSADRLHLNPLGHERVAQAALVALGLDPDRANWDEPLPPAPVLPPREKLAGDLAWGRDHLLPWLGRRIRHTSSGAGRTGKYLTYRTVAPGGQDADQPWAS